MVRDLYGLYGFHKVLDVHEGFLRQVGRHHGVDVLHQVPTLPSSDRLGVFHSQPLPDQIGHRVAQDVGRGKLVAQSRLLHGLVVAVLDVPVLERLPLLMKDKVARNQLVRPLVSVLGGPPILFSLRPKMERRRPRFRCG